MEESEMDDPGKYSVEIRDQLDRMMTHTMFRGAKRSCSFLRYITDKTLNGESYQIKEFSIAVDAFGLEPTFDQQIDPRIRVEAKRLRDRLKLYYDGPGMEDPVIIHMEKGSYVPSFRIRSRKESPRQTNVPSDGASVLLDGRFLIHLTFINDAVEPDLFSRVCHFQNAYLNSLFERGGTSSLNGSLADILKLQKESQPLALELRFHTMGKKVNIAVRLSLPPGGVLLQSRESVLKLGSDRAVRAEAVQEANFILDFCRSMKS